MVEGINEIKTLISNQVEKNSIFVEGQAFTGFQKTYFTTNENIKDYLDLINYNEKYSALTVLASGDQLFNLLNKDILNIDTFDINKLTEYYVFGIRLAMIEKYTYLDYLKVFSILLNEKTSFNTINSILYGLLPLMDTKYRIFWKEILDFNYKLQKNNKDKLNLTRLLFFGFLNNKEYNIYLDNEEEYNKLKNNLKQSHITFETKNVLELHKRNKQKYDVILLSNILDYIHNHLGMGWNLNKFINNIKKISNGNCDIFLHYIFHYYSSNYTRHGDVILGAFGSEKILRNNEIYKLPMHNDSRVGDGVILIKK